MTKLPLFAFAAFIAAGSIAAPAFAATATANIVPGHVPYCSANEGPGLDAQKDALATQLRLSTKPGSVIDVWNGCLNVITTTNGTSTTAFYDPDSLRLIAEI